MAKTVKVTIDGTEIKAPEGANLVDAAESAGIHIPNLCYMKGMKGIGACRLCMVEIEGGRGTSIACNTKVKDGMVVKTTSDSITDSRRFIIDMILSMHPLDCMTCTKAGVCRLQKYAYDLEVKESSFTRKKFGYPTDEANPFIKRDPEYCILCARCVRVCEEQDTNVLDFMGRGVGAKVVTDRDRPLHEAECTFCGSCVDACPVNALLEQDRWRKGREWEYDATMSTCTLCGDACPVKVSTKDGSVQKVNNGGAEGSASRYICAIGRFGYDYLVSDNRVTTPMKKEKGKFVEIPWDEALDIAAGALKKAGKNAGILSNAAITNETALALAKLAKAVKTENYDTSLSLYATAGMLTNSGKASIDDADLIVMVGLDTSQHRRVLPALDASVRRRTKRGAKLIVVNSAETAMDSAATLKVGGQEAASLKAIASACVAQGLKADKKLTDALKGAKSDESATAAADLIVKAENVLVIASPALSGAASNLALIKGTCVTVTPEANARGVALMGMKGSGGSYKDILAGGMKVLYVVGEQAITKKPKADFVIAQVSHMTAATKDADLILPAATYLESAGSIVDAMGNMKKTAKAVPAPGDAKADKDIVLGIAEAMGKKITISGSDVSKAASAKAKPTVAAFEKDKALEADFGKVMAATNTSVMATTRMLWLMETPATVKA